MLTCQRHYRRYTTEQSRCRYVEQQRCTAALELVEKWVGFVVSGRGEQPPKPGFIINKFGIATGATGLNWVESSAVRSVPALDSADLQNEGWKVPSTEADRQQPGQMSKFCLFLVCVSFLVVFSNEFSFRIFHGKAYLSTITTVLLPIAVLMTGNALRGMSVPIGKWWTAFGLWLAVCAPFSFWRSDTLVVLENFYIRSFLMYFALTACVLRINHAKKVMHTLVFSTALVILTCTMFGSVSSDGRFAVPSSGFSFFANANELALQLVFGIVVLFFPFFEKAKFWRIVSVVLIPLAGIYALRTASRGIVLASIAIGLTVFWTSRTRARLIVCITATIAIVVVAVMPEVRSRLMSMVVDANSEAAYNQDVRSAIESKKSRENIFWESVRMTFRHPVVGVGPGEFAAAEFSHMTNNGQWTTWLGTHNSYTEVSSESGLPGFLFYVATMVLCIRMNYRMYKYCLRNTALREHTGMSLCMLLATVLYAVSTCFFHIGYSSFLPVIAGLTAATYLDLRRVSPDFDPGRRRGVGALQ